MLTIAITSPRIMPNCARASFGGRGRQWGRGADIWVGGVAPWPSLRTATAHRRSKFVDWDIQSITSHLGRTELVFNY